MNFSLGDTKLPSWGSLDISLKIATVVVGAGTCAAAIILPNKREKEQAALDMFDKPWSRCSKTEHTLAEFSAGRRRWEDFFESKVYPITRKLPGAQNPILNPYRDAEPLGGGQDDDE